MVQDRKEGAETTKTPVQSVSTVILSTYVLSLKVIFRRVKGAMRNPLECSPWGSVTPEIHHTPVIQVILMELVGLVELVGLMVLDQISDYPASEGISSSYPGSHQQTRLHRE